MSLLYSVIKSMGRPVIRGQLEKAVADPASYLKEIKRKQEKPLPLAKLHKSYIFEESLIGSTPCYKVHSRDPKGHGLILYFFGGGYCRPGSTANFKYAQDMADKTGYDVWLVWYPLFPDATGYQIAASGAEVYKESLKTYTAKEISLYGNSSGASLCLTLCGFLREYEPDIPLPGKIVAHSPCVRIPTSEDEQQRMNEQDRKDMVIPSNYINMYSLHPEIFKDGGYTMFSSPIEQSWIGYPEILFIFGEDEVFSAYVPSIHEKCREDNVEYEVYIGKGCHCFSYVGFLPEAKPGRKKIYHFLMK